LQFKDFRVAQIIGWIGRSQSEEQDAAGQAVDRFVARHGGAEKPAIARMQGCCSAAIGPARHFSAGTFGSVAVAFIGQPTLGFGTPLDAAAMATRLRASGSRLIDELRGAFAIAWLDLERGEGVIATDRMGIYPLFVRETQRDIAFASAPAMLPPNDMAKAALSPQAIFDYLYGHVVPAPRTIFEGVQRLLPGECFTFTDRGATRRRYWQPRFDESHDLGFDALRAGFLGALRASVADAIQGAQCGAFLSGGTDSSTIAGLMTQVGGTPAKTFSIGFAAAGFDEMDYARLASKHFGTKHHEYYVTPKDIVEAVPKLASSHAQPFGNSSALPTYFCARLARENGVDLLVGGDGGDELFGGNVRYAKQRTLSLYEEIPAAARKALIEPICRVLGRGPRIPLLGKGVSYVEQASVPMPERLETYNLLHRIGYREVLTEAVLAQIDVAEPARLNREAYFNPSAASLINRMLALDFKTTLADNDLPKVMQSCALAGLPVVFPMLDGRVVDFSLALPPAMKLKGTRLRYFFKEALRDFLPDAIIRKQKHGFGLPFGDWAVSDPALKALTFDTLNSFKRRQLVRVDFIDRLKDQLLPQHPNYYGTMAWVLMMLEMWLAQHHDQAAVNTPVPAHV